MPAPLVAVLIPVYNGAATLGACMASVMGQTYSNWVLYVVDNASADDSLSIARSASKQDPRVHVLHFDEHLGMLDNWNRAMQHAPADAAYIKQLNVDDQLLPTHLERLVRVGESHPEAGVVSAYFRYGDRRVPSRRVDAVEIVSGRTTARNVLLGRSSDLVHPSAMLLRRSAVPTWPVLFRSEGFPPGHSMRPPLTLADKEAYFDVLEKFDLAFVPEVLANVRKDGESATTFSSRAGAWHPSRIETILRHGDRFLERGERLRALRRSARKHALSLAWRLLRGTARRDTAFVEYQQKALAHLLPRLEHEPIGIARHALRLAARLLADTHA